MTSTKMIPIKKTSHTLTWLAGAVVVFAAAAIVPPAQAQDQSYDGYCYAKKEHAKTTGTVIGAIAGGLLGSQVSKNERGLGTVGGAVIGGVVGRSIGSSSVKCLNGEYYSYQSGYYPPASPPEGYDVVYYKTRPSTSTYSTVYYDTQRHTSPGYAYNNGYSNQSYNNGRPYNSQPYNTRYDNNGTQGWRDSYGNWHAGRPAAFGWKDDRGQWHEGRFASYGYQDHNGSWHETPEQNDEGSADYTPNY